MALEPDAAEAFRTATQIDPLHADAERTGALIAAESYAASSPGADRRSRARRVVLSRAVRGENVGVMAQNDTNESIGETDDELERWRRAAEDSLQQLDWAIGYLHGIGKNREARTLAANRRTIRQRVLERPAEPVPTRG